MQNKWIETDLCPSSLERVRIDAIGFGPGDEETAHTVNDSVSLEDMVKATEFYALLPSLIK